MLSAFLSLGSREFRAESVAVIYLCINHDVNPACKLVILRIRLRPFQPCVKHKVFAK